MASETVTATVDVDHVERQLLEAVSSPGFGPIASNGLLAVRALRVQLARVTAERDKAEKRLAKMMAACDREYVDSMAAYASGALNKLAAEAAERIRAAATGGENDA